MPIIQASQLLQARKTDVDVNSICEMCDKMNANQVSKKWTKKIIIMGNVNKNNNNIHIFNYGALFTFINEDMLYTNL